MFAAAVRLIGENANVLMDRTPAEARAAAERAIAELGADVELRRLRLRESAGRYFADVVVTVPPGQAVVEGHESADQIEAAVERRCRAATWSCTSSRAGAASTCATACSRSRSPSRWCCEAHDITIFEQGDGDERVAAPEVPGRPDLREAARVADRVERRSAQRPGWAPCRRTSSRSSARSRRARRTSADGTPSARSSGSCASAPAPRAAARQAALDRRRARRLPHARRRARGLAGRRASAGGELEEELRQRIAGIADVVIRTEPERARCGKVRAHAASFFGQANANEGDRHVEAEQA